LDIRIFVKIVFVSDVSLTDTINQAFSSICHLSSNVCHFAESRRDSAPHSALLNRPDDRLPKERALEDARVDMT